MKNERDNDKVRRSWEVGRWISFQLSLSLGLGGTCLLGRTNLHALVTRTARFQDKGTAGVGMGSIFIRPEKKGRCADFSM